MSASLCVLAPDFLSGGWRGTEGIGAHSPFTHLPAAPLIPPSRTHLLLFLKTQFLITASTMTAIATSIPNRGTTEWHAASGMGWGGVEEETLPLVCGCHPEAPTCP